VLFDAVFVPGGDASVEALSAEADALHFVNEAFKHCKTVGATGAGVKLLEATYVSRALERGDDPGVVTGTDAKAKGVAAAFVEAMAEHRHWDREKGAPVPA
jgi:catalase